MSPAPGDLVVDGELKLVPRRPDDAREVYALIDAHRTALTEWLTWIDATFSVEDVRRYARFAQAQFEQSSGFDYSVCENGAIAGGIGLYHLDWTSRMAHIGYWLAPTARGRGLITRATRALTTWAFTEHNLHRIEIRCVVENAKSRAVAERLGYSLEGYLNGAYLLHGRFRNLALYAMQRDEWKPAAWAGQCSK
jgi:ribosomal-protein-serine acetyltransferase